MFHILTSHESRGDISGEELEICGEYIPEIKIIIIIIYVTKNMNFLILQIILTELLGPVFPNRVKVSVSYQGDKLCVNYIRYLGDYLSDNLNLKWRIWP